MVQRSEASARMKKIRGALNQSAFAEATGIPQSKISECEGGKYPSVQMFVLLANYAEKQGQYDDAMWCWNQAGIDRTAMLSVGGYITSGPEWNKAYSAARAEAQTAYPDDPIAQHRMATRIADRVMRMKKK